MSELFMGHSSEMKKNSQWLASEDLLDRGEMELTIAAIHKHHNVEFDAGRKEEVVFSIEFEKAKKQLVCNSTNRKKLVEKYGAKVKEWIGKKVILYVDHNVKLMGKTTCGIRIK